MTPAAPIAARFAALGIPVRPFPADDLAALAADGAPRLKTLLLRNKRGNAFWLAALPWDARLDADGLRAFLSQSKISVATDADLAERVGVPSGAVSPLALALPAAAGLPFLWDTSVAGSPSYFLHPGDASVRWRLSAAELASFLSSLGVVPAVAPLAAAGEGRG